MASLSDIREQVAASPVGARHVLLYVLTLGTAVLYAFKIGQDPYWVDETITIGFARQYTSLELLTEIPDHQPHLPTYYVLVRLWMGVAGESEVALRTLSLAFGVGTVPLVYAAGRRLYDAEVGLYAGAVTSVWPLLFHHSRELRMYSLLAFAGALGLWLLVKLLDDDVRWPLAVAFVLSVWFLASVHVFGGIQAVASLVIGGAIAYRRGDRRTLYSIGVAGLVVGLVGLVGVVKLLEGDPTRVEQIVHVSPNLGIGTVLSLLTESVLVDVGLGTDVLAIGVLVGTIAVAASYGVSDRDALLWAWLLVPAVIVVVIHVTIHPILRPKYLIGALVAVPLLFGASLRRLSDSRVRVLLTSLLVVSLLPQLAWSYAIVDDAKFDVRTSFVEQRAEPDDVVVINARFEDNPVDFYLDSRFRRVSVSTVERDWRDRLPPGDIDVWLIDATPGSSVWEITDALERTHGEPRRWAWTSTTVFYFSANATTANETVRSNGTAPSPPTFSRPTE